MLNSKQKQELKRLAHSMKAIIMIGKKGLSENLTKELEAALLAHELVKIKFLESAAEDQEAFVETLSKQVKAELVENRGHIATLYRRHPEKPKIEI